MKEYKVYSVCDGSFEETTMHFTSDEKAEQYRAFMLKQFNEVIMYERV